MSRRALPVCFVAVVLLCSLAVCPPAVSTKAAQTPHVRLVLLIAVDQFRADYLPRFRSEYRQGIDTLLTRGAVFTDAHIEHARTYTATGHATMLTGAFPSTSGIIANAWYDRGLQRVVTSVSDGSVANVGGSRGETGSPHRMMAATLSDEIKRAAGESADTPPKSIGISGKAGTRTRAGDGPLARPNEGATCLRSQARD